MGGFVQQQENDEILHLPNDCDDALSPSCEYCLLRFLC